jgi:hypothetical protein
VDLTSRGAVYERPYAAELPRAQQAAERTFTNVTWDTVFHVGGSMEDTVLLRPRMLAADAEQLYVYDLHSFRLTSFDRQGQVRWSVGRQGQGPREFANPIHLAPMPSSAGVAVLDPDAARITTVSDAGVFGPMTPLDGAAYLRVVPLAGETLLLPLGSGTTFWRTPATASAAADSGAYPTAQLSDAHPFLRSAAIGVAPDGRHWGAAFVFGNVFTV